jgi:hypothetical protein
VAPQRHRTAGAGRDRVDDGGDVVEVPLDRIDVTVAARPETSTVHGERREVVSEHHDERVEGGVIGDGAVNHDKSGTASVDPHNEGCSVAGADVEPARFSSGESGVAHRIVSCAVVGRLISAANTETARANAPGCSA